MQGLGERANPDGTACGYKSYKPKERDEKHLCAWSWCVWRDRWTSTVLLSWVRADNEPEDEVAVAEVPD